MFNDPFCAPNVEFISFFLSIYVCIYVFHISHKNLYWAVCLHSAHTTHASFILNDYVGHVESHQLRCMLKTCVHFYGYFVEKILLFLNVSDKQSKGYFGPTIPTVILQLKASSKQVIDTMDIADTENI